jgi:hypothetical protein
MRVKIIGSTCAAAMLAVTVVAAQNPSPTQAPTQGNPQQRPAERNDPGAPRVETDKQVTLVGCVAREGASDIVLTGAATPAGTSGSVAGGVTGSTSTAAIGTGGAATGAATATTGSAVASKYRLSGERDLDQFIGQRVEIVGRMDPGDAAKAPGSPNASSGSATPSEAGGDSNKSATSSSSTSAASAPTPHVTITSVRAMGGSCL